jgi:hypothetical protein
MTALSGMSSLRNVDETRALTNRLRTEGTEYLLAAAPAPGHVVSVAATLCRFRTAEPARAAVRGEGEAPPE